MLEGKELAAAIRAAMELKSAQPGAGKVGPTALGRALGIAQPSATELLKTGRLSKGKLPALLDYFADVVGPDHFGMPFTKFEAEFIQQLRRIPAPDQQKLLSDLAEAGARVAEATSGLTVTPSPPHQPADPSRKRSPRKAA
jgi:hypothetical protein